jgi:hypothetical protein
MESENNRRRAVSKLYTHAVGDSAKVQCIRRGWIFKGEKQFIDT